jgi:hypothetical protein
LFDQDGSLFERVEDLPVQELVPQFADDLFRTETLLRHNYHPLKFGLKSINTTWTDLKGAGHHYQLRRALKTLKVTSRKRWFQNWRSIRVLAIVPINRRRDGGWHWVVFVPHGVRPFILDPMKGRGRRRYDFRGMRARGFYIAIEVPVVSGNKDATEEDAEKFSPFRLPSIKRSI